MSFHCYQCIRPSPCTPAILHLSWRKNDELLTFSLMEMKGPLSFTQHYNSPASHIHVGPFDGWINGHRHGWIDWWKVCCCWSEQRSIHSIVVALEYIQLTFVCLCLWSICCIDTCSIGYNSQADFVTSVVTKVTIVPHQMYCTLSDHILVYMVLSAFICLSVC